MRIEVHVVLLVPALIFNNIYSEDDYIKIIVSDEAVMIQGLKCVVQRDDCWFVSPEMKYLFKFIFPCLRSDVETYRGVVFRHSTRNACRIRQKVGNGVS